MLMSHVPWSQVTDFPVDVGIFRFIPRGSVCRMKTRRKVTNNLNLPQFTEQFQGTTRRLTRSNSLDCTLEALAQ